MVGRYKTSGQARDYATGRAKADRAWCDRHGKEFMPVVFPGFAWSNLKKDTHIFKSTNDVPVGDSRFLTFGDLPSDHYLWLVGEAAKRLRGEVLSTPEPPVRTSAK